MHEQFSDQLENWLKGKRDEYSQDMDHWHAIDDLLNDTRAAKSIGKFPWQLKDGDLPYG